MFNTCLRYFGDITDRTYVSIGPILLYSSVKRIAFSVTTYIDVVMCVCVYVCICAGVRACVCRYINACMRSSVHMYVRAYLRIPLCLRTSSRRPPCRDGCSRCAASGDRASSRQPNMQRHLQRRSQVLN